MFTYFVTCETSQICPGCGYCSECLRESIIQFEGCILLVLFKVIVINKYDMFYTSLSTFLLLHKEWILNNFKFVFYATICQQAITVRAWLIILYVNSTTEEVPWSLRRCWEKNIHIYLSESIICRIVVKNGTSDIGKKSNIMHPYWWHGHTSQHAVIKNNDLHWFNKTKQFAQGVLLWKWTGFAAMSVTSCVQLDSSLSLACCCSMVQTH